MNKLYPNLSEIITTTLRNRTGALATSMTANNKLLTELMWDEQEPGSMPVPEFIKLRSQGKAKIVSGRVYIKKDG